MVSELTESKKKQKGESVFNSLPRDIFERIFLSLPVSTLLRCTQVCKQWRGTIRDPEFVTTHLQQAPTCRLLFLRQESVSKKLYPSDAIIFDESWSRSAWAMPVIGPDDLLCGSCNGLLCVYTKSSTIKIANFTTGECLHVDKPVKNLKGDDSSHYSFGFHPVTKEYKIAHFFSDSGTNSRGTFNGIQVYTLGSEKWRDVRTPEPLSVISVKDHGVVNVDGIMYWMVSKSTEAGWQKVVMSFDLGSESFACMQMPAAAPEDHAVGSLFVVRHWIKEIDGKVSIVAGQVFRRRPTLFCGKMRIWTLDSIPEQRWSQKYNIQFARMHMPAGPNFIHRDKLVTHCNDLKTLYSYELHGKDGDTKVINLVRLFTSGPRKPNNMQSYICVKSLVRLDIYEKGGIVRRPKRREGWELKRWEKWEREVDMIESSESKVTQTEEKIFGVVHSLAVKVKQRLHRLPDEMQYLGPEMDRVIQTCPPPDKPRSSRRRNSVELLELSSKWWARVDKIKKLAKSVTEATRKVSEVLDGSEPHQGSSSSNAGISSQCNQ